MTPLNYTDRFYNHFERTSYNISFKDTTKDKVTYAKKQNNVLLRYRMRIPEFKFQKTNLTIRYFKEGTGEYFFKNKRIKVEDNKFLITNPNDGWEYINEKNGHVDILSFAVCNDTLNQFNFYLKKDTVDKLDSPDGKIHENPFFIEKMLNVNHYSSGRLLQYIYDLSNQGTFKYTCPFELTVEILNTIFDEQRLGNKISNSIDVKKESTKQEVLQRLLVAYEFIHDNINRPISIDELSNVCSLSKFHLYDSFKKAFGKTPHQYVNRLKIARAKLLLQNNHLSVSEVSETLGFSDLSVFSKVFKKAYGNPPSHYSKL
ncbi:AraC family transcriptional regulator [Flagellimonas sp. HMM57]|uniref:helix-turn-helix transcriptional regulator n=1 Tax=unclassified Flagellimonas TaxID=2644544 RepID=UPI0013D53F8C|nr:MULTISPECIES: AraC family transcriptional regulator [unclassified Flagellimonas]UII75011.1 AraC family transcriptional regulator [Flagellimonas sp. HMM57]